MIASSTIQMCTVSISPQAKAPRRTTRASSTARARSELRLDLTESSVFGAGVLTLAYPMIVQDCEVNSYKVVIMFKRSFDITKYEWLVYKPTSKVTVNDLGGTCTYTSASAASANVWLDGGIMSVAP